MEEKQGLITWLPLGSLRLFSCLNREQKAGGSGLPPAAHPHSAIIPLVHQPTLHTSTQLTCERQNNGSPKMS